MNAGARAASPLWVLGLYLRVRPAAGAYLAARCAGFPHFGRLEAALPARGAILDAGCGHGFLSVLAGARGPGRRILGIDRMASRLEAGRAVAVRTGLGNVALHAGLLEALPAGPFDAIVFADVLMYLPLGAQEAVLADGARRLAPGGRLVIKEQMRRPRFKAGLVRIQEGIVLGLKRGLSRESPWKAIAPTGIHLWEETALLGFLGRIGLRPGSRALDHWSYLSHALVIGESASSRRASRPAPDETAGRIPEARAS